VFCVSMSMVLFKSMRLLRVAAAWNAGDPRIEVVGQPLAMLPYVCHLES